MRWRALDAKIRRFAEDVTSALAEQRAGGRPDWGSIWGLEDEIQTEFDSRVRYPSRRDHDRAWQRFQAARDRLGESRERHLRSLEGSGGGRRERHESAATGAEVVARYAVVGALVVTLISLVAVLAVGVVAVWVIGLAVVTLLLVLVLRWQP